MSGSNRQLARNRNLGRAAKKLATNGLTHRQIAEQLGVKSNQVKGLIALGERFDEHNTPAAAGQGDSQ